MPGARIFDFTSISITNGGNRLDWNGLEIQIEPKSLPHNIEECILDVRVSIDGPYLPPKDYEFVSAVYWIQCTPSVDFQNLVTVKIHHFWKGKDSSKISLLHAKLADQEKFGCEYKFEEYKCDGLINHSRILSAKVSSFCELGAGAQVDEKQESAIQYAIGYFYKYYRNDGDGDVQNFILVDLVMVPSEKSYKKVN